MQALGTNLPGHDCHYDPVDSRGDRVNKEFVIKDALVQNKYRSYIELKTAIFFFFFFFSFHFLGL